MSSNLDFHKIDFSYLVVTLKIIVLVPGNVHQTTKILLLGLYIFKKLKHF